MKRIILFRFHDFSMLCQRRIDRLTLLNPEILLFGLYGGIEEKYEEFCNSLFSKFENIYCLRGKTAFWKRTHADLAVRLWYEEVGKAVSFDMLHFIEWDFLMMESIEKIYKDLPKGGVGFSILVPVKEIENEWYWLSKESQQVEWTQLRSYLHKQFGYNQTPYACECAGISFSRNFLEQYSSISVPELCHDELRIPIYCQIFNIDMHDMGFRKQFFNDKEKRFFNCDGKEIETKDILQEMKNPQGRRVFHPFRRVVINRFEDYWINMSIAMRDRVDDFIEFKNAIEAKRGTNTFFWNALIMVKDTLWKIVHTLPSKKKNNESKEDQIDYYLISFPKCGRTWLRVMIKKALQEHFGFTMENPFDLLFDTSQLNVARNRKEILPSMLVTHDDEPQWKKVEELERSKRKYKGKRVVFLVRDPRDVLVSAYYHNKYRRVKHCWFEKVTNTVFLDERDESLGVESKRVKANPKNLYEYIHEPMGSLETLLAFYTIWEENRNVPKEFLLVRYEDIHKNPQKELRRVLLFLGCETISDETIDKAVEFSLFKKMRKMEEEGIYDTENYLRVIDKDNKESFKTRRGIVGGFVDYLSKEEIEYVNREIDEKLSSYYKYGTKQDDGR